MRPLQARLFFLSILAIFAECTTLPKPGLEERMRGLAAQMTGTERESSDELTDKEIGWLDTARFNLDQLTAQDARKYAAALEFEATLTDDDWPVVVELSRRSDLMVLSGPLAILALDHHRFGEAARLLVTTARSAPRDQRAYSTWKRFDLMFETREDYPLLRSEATIALLGLFRDAADGDRQVIGDLFEGQEITGEKLPEMQEGARAFRKVLEETLRDYSAEIAEQDEAAGKPATLWIEDHLGLRQVDRRQFVRARTAPSYYEIRMEDGDSPGGPQRHWGTLRMEYDNDGVAVAELHAWLRDLARRWGDNAPDLGSRHGAIGVLRPGRRFRIDHSVDALEKALGNAPAACILACLAVDCEMGKRRDEAVELGRETLAAVRACARRIAEHDSAPHAGVDNDKTVLDAMGDVSHHARRLLADTGLFDMEAAAGTFWQEMPFRWSERAGDDSMATMGYLHVLLEGDEIVMTELERVTGPATPPSFRAEVVRIPRSALSGASFGNTDAGYGNGLVLRIETKTPLLHRIVHLDHPSSSAFDSYRNTWFDVPCDTVARRKEVQEALQRFASGSR